MICTISKHRAERRGYADAMMLDWEDRVAQCTGANIFFIQDGKIHTPMADCFLPLKENDQRSDAREADQENDLDDDLVDRGGHQLPPRP
jgi:hypothetical protein